MKREEIKAIFTDATDEHKKKEQTKFVPSFYYSCQRVAALA